MIGEYKKLPARHSPVFCVCSHISRHGVAAAVVAVKFSPAVSSFPEFGLAASIVVIAVWFSFTSSVDGKSVNSGALLLSVPVVVGPWLVSLVLPVPVPDVSVP